SVILPVKWPCADGRPPVDTSTESPKVCVSPACRHPPPAVNHGQTVEGPSSKPGRASWGCGPRPLLRDRPAGTAWPRLLAVVSPAIGSRYHANRIDVDPDEGDCRERLVVSAAEVHSPPRRHYQAVEGSMVIRVVGCLGPATEHLGGVIVPPQ